MDSNNITEGKRSRPWIRYCARNIDVYLLTSFVLTLQMLIYPEKQLDANIAAIGVHVVWVLFEAQLLATWGTTPGKWLLRTTVRDSANNKLSLKTALIRSTLVWSVGMALYTFLSSFTQVLAYMSLKEKGKTLWDEYCKCNVTHEKIELERIPLITVAILLPLLIIGLVYQLR